MPTIEERRQAVVHRLVAACQTDARVVATFLGGSSAREATDAYSNLDIGVITGDVAYDDFLADHHAFVRKLGAPVFLETFSADGVDGVCFTLADGVEGEVVLGRQSQFPHMHVGPYKVLLDATGLLSGAVFPLPQVGESAQVETLRGIMVWFWHDLYHHVITPLARGQLWSAHGGLADLRLACVNLIRLREDFCAPLTGYRHIEQALGIEQLAPLAATCCALERGAMLEAAFRLVRIYQNVALPLAQRYQIAYPADLERVMLRRLQQLGQTVRRERILS
jgi:hypothetical protein